MQYKIQHRVSQAKKRKKAPSSASASLTSVIDKKYLAFFAIILYKSCHGKEILGKRKRQGKFDRSVIIGIIIAVLVIALTLWGPLRKFRVAEEKETC